MKPIFRQQKCWISGNIRSEQQKQDVDGIEYEWAKTYMENVDIQEQWTKYRWRIAYLEDSGHIQLMTVMETTS
jgi:hypothetical protein